jgi:hypothetical protein
MTYDAAVADLAVQLDLILRRSAEQQIEFENLQVEIVRTQALLENARHKWGEIKSLGGCPQRGCGEVHAFQVRDGAVYARCRTHCCSWPSSQAAADAWQAKQAEQARKPQPAKSLWP